ncbi:MAG: 50S ribosomal protein L9 [Dehalococcoidia bacterium]|nr:50S ribosomal protein L9 [Dehalococcoidia bacterium]
MRVLFLQDISGAGKAGETKEVASGYARNFLLPKALAVPATESALKNVQYQRKIDSAKSDRAHREVSSLAEKLSKTELVFKVKLGEQKRMHGSITNADIVEELLRKTGHEVDKHKVDLEEPIKGIGEHVITIHLAKEAVAKVKVLVEEE